MIVLAAQLILEASKVFLCSTRLWALVCMVLGVRSSVALAIAMEVWRDWRRLEELLINEGD